MKKEVQTRDEPTDAPAPDTGPEPRQDVAFGILIAVLMAGLLWLALLGVSRFFT